MASKAIWTEEDAKSVSTTNWKERLVGRYHIPGTETETFQYFLNISKEGMISRTCINAGFGGSSTNTKQGPFTVDKTILHAHYTKCTSDTETWGRYGGEDSWNDSDDIDQKEDFHIIVKEGAPIQLKGQDNNTFALEN
jgi:hypothetical protein